MSAPVRLTVMGAGLIGKRHIQHILARPEAMLSSIVDPTPAARELAASLKVDWFPSFQNMLSANRPEGVVVATPNQVHVANGMDCIAARIPALIEKPLADDVVAAQTLVEAAERAGVPLLTGHHRRHSPMIQRAKAEIDSGRLGQVVSVHGMFWLIKPDDYFDVTWRRERGAGPVFLNLIHDVDLLRYLCGDIVAVQAAQSNRLRGNAVEETAVILLHFASGALGTVNVSDTIQSPWSWEFTAGENPAYSHTQEACYQIGGTKASLAIPQLDLWHHPSKASWWAPIERERLRYEKEDPLGLQIANFCEVIRGTAAPVVTGREGLMTLTVIDAIKRAAETGDLVSF
ncbi:Gfo/Idh/MocA family protein [Bradyrhizobium sp. STM 3557]|uniref:Gfo/Idh/MocA family protein n=1 Tax=Bradyrhizobium sp. STM 3557 TaxID=578920 RepID=UPI00389029E0